MSVYVLYNVVSMFVNDVVCNWDILFSDCILTLLVSGILNEDDWVVRVEGGSYDCVTVWKRIDWTRSYGLIDSYECATMWKKNRSD